MSNDMTALRAHLFETLQGLRNKTVDIDTARAINDVAKTLVDTAKVEVEFLRLTEGDSSAFIAPTAATVPALPPPAEPERNNGIVSITRHAIGR